MVGLNSTFTKQAFSQIDVFGQDGPNPGRTSRLTQEGICSSMHISMDIFVVAD